MELLQCLVLCVCWHFYGDQQIWEDVAALDHANYHKRIAAQKRLQQRGNQALPILLGQLNKPNATLEMSRRLQLLTDKYTYWYYHPAPDGWPADKLPWIDMIQSSQYPQIGLPEPGDQRRLLGSRHNTRNDLWWYYYGGVLVEDPFGSGAYPLGRGPGQYSYPVYRYATQLLVNDLFRDGWQRSEIIQLLNEMAACEAAYIKNGAGPYVP